MSSNPAKRLAVAVTMRRTELDLTQLEVYYAGGPSNSTLTQIENGRMETLSGATARKLDKALRWKPGSARALWNEGTQPVPLVSLEKPTDTVGGVAQTPGQYVGGTGERVDEGRREDGAVLQAITAMSATLDQLLAGQREQSGRLDGLASDSRDTRDRLGALEDAQRELSARVAQLEEPRP